MIQRMSAKDQILAVEFWNEVSENFQDIVNRVVATNEESISKPRTEEEELGAALKEASVSKRTQNIN